MDSLGVAIIALLVTSAMMAGCAPEEAVEVTPMEEASPTPTQSPMHPTRRTTTVVSEPSATTPPQAAADVPDDARAAVAWAIEDLASRLHVPAEAIALLSIEAVEWRDSSLGCPQPGHMYLQVITPGYRFVLRVDGATHEYHSARGAEQAVLCESET